VKRRLKGAFVAAGAYAGSLVTPATAAEGARLTVVLAGGARITASRSGSALLKQMEKFR